MARTPFRVEVLTPEGLLFDDEVEMLSTRTAVGSIGVLANHAPLLALLEPTELRLYTAGSEVKAFAQGEGYLQVADSRALVLVDEVFEKDELDSSELQSRLDRASERVERAEDDSEEKRQAERERRRYEAFLKLAGRGR